MLAATRQILVNGGASLLLKIVRNRCGNVYVMRSNFVPFLVYFLALKSQPDIAETTFTAPETFLMNSILASPCSTVAFLGDFAFMGLPIKVTKKPVVVFPTVNEKIQDFRKFRQKSAPDKYSYNCFTFIVHTDSSTAAKIKVSHEKIGFRGKDRFIFMNIPPAHSFFSVKNLRNKIRFFTCLPTYSNADAIGHRYFSVETGKVRLDGYSLRGATVTVPPLVVRHPRGPPGGTQVEMFTSAAKYYNFSMSIDYDIMRRGGQGSPLPNGSWTGIIGALKRDEIDVSLIGTQISRYPHADHTSPIFVDPSSFLVKRPKIHVKWDALIGPLSGTVWTLWLVALLAITLTAWLTLKYPNFQTNTLQLSVVITLAITFEQAIKIPASMRILAAVWMLTTIVLGTGYKDKLMNSLTFLEREDVPTSIEDFLLPQYQDYTLLQDGWLISFRLNNSNSPAIVKLRDRFVYMSNSGDCVVKAALEDNIACIGYDQFQAVSISYNLTLNYKFFAPIKSNKVLPGVPVVIGLRKDSPFTEDWNKIVGNFRDTGLYPRIHHNVLTVIKSNGMKALAAREYGNDVYERLMGMMEEDGMVVRPLVITNLITIFIVHGSICLLALFPFVHELLC